MSKPTIEAVDSKLFDQARETLKRAQFVARTVGPAPGRMSFRKTENAANKLPPVLAESDLNRMLVTRVRILFPTATDHIKGGYE